jgi:hypothetical protein
MLSSSVPEGVSLTRTSCSEGDDPPEAVPDNCHHSIEASNSAISAVLVQEKEEEGKLRQIPVYFASEAFWFQDLLFRAGKNRICGHHGSKEAKALL